jgi:tRNA(Met) cytidine acetyltransferase
MADWLAETAASMRRSGIRRLLVLSGDPLWSASLVRELRLLLPGDWLWVGRAEDGAGITATPATIKSLLGREFQHGVFDARTGLAADALAALAGMLTAGSWLVLLTPPWDDWPLLPDRDSLRWSEQPEPIATPSFIHHFQHSLQHCHETALFRQHQTPSLPVWAARPRWQPPKGGPTVEQQALLERLLAAQSGIYVLTAPRGRGKSTLAGMLAAGTKARCWVAAPARQAADVLAQYAANRARFFSPDALLEHCRTHPAADWLLVDEAAAIPLPLLRQLISYFPRVLLTTTVQGYEGTGRGFLLKFCASLPQWHSLTLQQPLRWAAADPLESWLAEALLLDPVSSGGGGNPRLSCNPPDSAGPVPIPAPQEPGGVEPAQDLSLHHHGDEPAQDRSSGYYGGAPSFSEPGQESWERHPQALRAFYDLLTGAHYRTSPLDLRRLMDAPGQHFIVARIQDAVIGGLWTVDEGGLTPEMAHEVWAGRRRPPGNLVAQSLAAHGGIRTAAQLLSRRVSRIAVAAAHRRRGVGRELLRQARMRAAEDGLDFLSVSFGLTDELRQFWQASGFRLVHIGSRLEASSGCYSAMALLPLSAAGQRMTQRAEVRFARAQRLSTDDGGWELDDGDWRDLAGFAFAHRPPEACRAALLRLLRLSPLPLPALRGELEQRLGDAEMVTRIGVTGKKALLIRRREETAAALLSLDEKACGIWRRVSEPGGYLADVSDI